MNKYYIRIGKDKLLNEKGYSRYEYILSHTKSIRIKKKIRNILFRTTEIEDKIMFSLFI